MFKALILILFCCLSLAKDWFAHIKNDSRLTSEQKAIALKKEYKRLAMRHHPDRGGDEEVFKDIKKQYDQVSTI